MLPSGRTATAIGQLNLAYNPTPKAGPSVNPFCPLPANVVTKPRGEIFRI